MIGNLRFFSLKRIKLFFTTCQHVLYKRCLRKQSQNIQATILDSHKVSCYVLQEPTAPILRDGDLRLRGHRHRAAGGEPDGHAARDLTYLTAAKFLIF